MGGVLAVTLSVAAPALAAEALPTSSLTWLAGQSNPRQTGIRPLVSRAGLLISFAIPANDPLAPFLRGRSFTYDNAAAAVTFLAHGQITRARAVLTALRRLVPSTGAIGFSYRVDRLGADNLQARAGTLAWVGYAMACYQRMTGDARFRATAERLAGFLQTLQHPTGLYRGGPDVLWVSTEHNLDAYVFFRELGRVTGRSVYQTLADQLKMAILRHLWVMDPTGGHFLRGFGDPTPALDANVLGALFLTAIGRPTEAGQAMAYVEATFLTTQPLPNSPARVTGYAPDAARATLWWEGSLQAAAAYRRVGDAAKASAVFQNVSRVRSVWRTQRRWHGALPYATPRYLDAEGTTFADWDSVAATSWWGIAEAILAGGVKIWDRD